MSLPSPIYFQDPESLQTMWGVALVMLIAIVDVIPARTVFEMPTYGEKISHHPSNIQQYRNLLDKSIDKNNVKNKLQRLRGTDFSG